LYPAYQEALESYSALDFDDLICKPSKMMEKSTACKKRWANKFKFVLVDEYQDTNSVQLRLIKAIAGKHMNLCVVGDDDQSIYAFRGAEVRNILRFSKDFKNAKVIYLQNNYRSTESVLNLANQVIAHNPDRHPKKLKATLAPGLPVKEIISTDEYEEAGWVADIIKETLARNDHPASEIAVLYRSSILSRVVELALRERNIAYRLIGGQSFFDHKEVKDIIAYLKFAAWPSDSISLRRIINYPSRGIGPKTLGRLSAWADDHNLPLHRALDNAKKILPDDNRALRAIAEFVEHIKFVRINTKRTRQLHTSVKQLIDKINLKGDLIKSQQSNKSVQLRMQMVEEFLSELESYCTKSSKPSLSDFLQRISLSEQEIEAENPEEINQMVTLQHFHGAKGLEFGVVFLVGVEEGLLPHDRVMNPHANDSEQSDLSEERRLFYVGITRAKKELYLTRAKTRQLRGKTTEKAPSRFILDLPDGLLDCEDHTRVVDANEAKSHLAAIRAMLGES